MSQERILISSVRTLFNSAPNRLNTSNSHGEKENAAITNISVFLTNPSFTTKFMTDSKSAAGSLTRPCVKCRAQEATLDSRSQPVCRYVVLPLHTYTRAHTLTPNSPSDCFTKFIATKCIKQIGILGKETRPPPSTTGGPPTGTRRYLLGLSLGVSSTVLLHLLNENVEFQLAKGRNAPFDLTVVHVDTSLQLSSSPSSSSPQTAAETALAAYRARYPRFAFHCIPLPSSTSSTSTTATTTTTTAAPAAALLQGVPTTTSAASRSDILRTLTRRALLSAAGAHACQALLLGHSTTALAELTLAEAAKGRGFALPWLVHDGPAPAPAPAPAVGPGVGVGAGVGVGDGDVDRSRLGLRGNGDGEGEAGAGSLEDAGAGASANGGGEGSDVDEPTVLVYHPLRDALRKELATYASLVSPPLTDLIPPDHSPKTGSGGGPTAAAVVSHKDLSIEEVMTRYFAEVEASYPSVVANVARTTGKLVRAGGAEGCALCGMPLDEDGDERWRGELGIQKETATSGVGGTGGRLCYGCKRSTGA